MDNTPQTTGNCTHTLSVYDYSTAAPNYTAWSGHGERRHYSAGGTSTDHHLKEKEAHLFTNSQMLYISLQVGLDTTTKLATHYNKRLLALHILVTLLYVLHIKDLKGALILGEKTGAFRPQLTLPTARGLRPSRARPIETVKWSGKTMNHWLTREERNTYSEEQEMRPTWTNSRKTRN